MIKTITDCAVEIGELLKPGAMKGTEAGNIPMLNEHYTCKLGNTTLLTGYPSSGKSFFAMNLQCALTINHGWKHLLYTPEMGNAAEIYITIVEILTGKSAGYNLTESDVHRLQPIIQENFVVFDPDTTPSMDALTKEIAKYAALKKINTFSIDNLNDLTHNIQGTQDIYFEQQMLLFNNCAKANNLHGFLLAHPAKPMPDDLDYPPTPDKIKGGSAFWSKGQTILSLRDSEEYLEVAVYKAKPRYVAKKGQFSLRKEYKRNTYSQTVNDKSVFLFEQDQQSAPREAPRNFSEPQSLLFEPRTESDELPF